MSQVEYEAHFLISPPKSGEYSAKYISEDLENLLIRGIS